MDWRTRIRTAMRRSPGNDIAEALGQRRPDVAVACCRALRAGRAMAPVATILVIGAKDVPDLVRIAGSTHGIVRGDIDSDDEIVRAIEAVARGGGWISPNVARHVLALVETCDSRDAAPLLLETLTSRERYLVLVVKDGAVVKDTRK
ncbi:hypothetical protein ACIA8C_35320 [Nocardia sp. NPDC051321]|uniref:hypothetical protein n=1 Tax=Nocardia sp. NPDC051321 TaxID=3364323 RepID=UPI00378A6FEC